MAVDGSLWIAGESSEKGGQVDTAYGKGDAWIVHADGFGNFLNAKVLGGHLDDKAMMIHPLSNGNVITGGDYDTAGGAFASIVSYSSYPNRDIFLSTFAPWNHTGVKEILIANKEIVIYPNPSNEQVTIEGDEQSNYELTITDVLGRSIYKASYIDKIKIAVDKWQKGVYYVQVSSDNGYRGINKLLVV